jgi:hypothetical protein
MAVFSRTQAASNERRTPGNKPRAESGTASFLLRGLAPCGVCGTVIRGVPVLTIDRTVEITWRDTFLPRDATR